MKLKETKEEMYAKLRQESWAQAVKTFSLHYIFSRRARRSARLLTFIKALGLLVPALIGALILSYGTNFVGLQWIVNFSIGVALLQFLLSLLSVVFKWEEHNSYANEAAYHHAELSFNYTNLANTPPPTMPELRAAFERLGMLHMTRAAQDLKQSITDLEDRRGMRAALREFQRPCVGCKTVPLSLASTDCDVCGKFAYPILTKLGLQ